MTSMNVDTETPVFVGKRLRAARLSANLSQIDLANLCSTGQGHISAIERGRRQPSIEMANALAEALGVTVHWLVGGDSCLALSTRAVGTEHLLSDRKTPAGLAALAGDTALCQSLDIQSVEWGALRSVTAPLPLTKEGYLVILLAMRGYVAKR
jgi:transcriptional regulator with XRE-family HTH domain